MIIKIYRILKKEKCKLYKFYLDDFNEIYNLINLLTLNFENIDEIKNKKYKYEINMLKNGDFKKIFYSIVQNKYEFSSNEELIIMNGGEWLKEENDLYFGGNLILKRLINKENNSCKIISQSHSLSIYDKDDYGCCKIQEYNNDKLNLISKQIGSDCYIIDKNCSLNKLFQILLKIDEIKDIQDLKLIIKEV